MTKIKIIECPRDAMQGFHNFIPTDIKIKYINALMEVGFDTIDGGSFVSPKAIPMLADTNEVFSQIKKSDKSTNLLAIVANERGMKEACAYPQVDHIGYPFSISETFQKKNTNLTISESYELLERLQLLAITNNKHIVAYLSMGFGNPYNEKWSLEIAFNWCEKIIELGISTISLSDTIGIAKVKDIEKLFNGCIKRFPNIEFGAHLHTNPQNWEDNLKAAYYSGCTRFDTAIMGFGGCPFATNKLTGNLPTENAIHFFEKNKIDINLNIEAFKNAFKMASSVFKE